MKSIININQKNNMKKNKLLAVVAVLGVLLSGCSKNDMSDKVKKDYRVEVIDNCEYIIVDYSSGYVGHGFMAHKGNCKFCEERRKERENN